MLAYTCSLVERARAEVVRLRGDQRGVTALEYGIIAAAMAAVLGVVFTGLTTDLTTLFNKIGTQLTK